MIAREKHTHCSDLTEPGPGVVDRLLRAGITIGLVLAVINGEGNVGTADLVMMIAAILIGTTAATGWDPFYEVFGWSTREADLLARYRAAREARAEVRARPDADPGASDAPQPE